MPDWGLLETTTGGSFFEPLATLEFEPDGALGGKVGCHLTVAPRIQAFRVFLSHATGTRSSMKSQGTARKIVIPPCCYRHVVDCETMLPCPRLTMQREGRQRVQFQGRMAGP